MSRFCRALAIFGLVALQSFKAMAEFDPIELDEMPIRELCKKVANPETRAALLRQQSGTEDVNNDGVPETAKTCWGGTMNASCVDYYDSTGAELQFLQMGFEWKDYWTYGRQAFRFEGKTFFLNSADDSFKEPVYVS